MVFVGARVVVSVVDSEGSEKWVDMNVLVEPRPRIDGAGAGGVGGAGPMRGERCEEEEEEEEERE